MKLREIVNILECEIICGEENLDVEVYSACGADMMSDVLAFVKDQAVLITGLVNHQVVRTAEMMDMRCVVFVRGKKPDESMMALAKSRGVVLLATGLRMFTACGLLWSAGLRGDSGL